MGNLRKTFPRMVGKEWEQRMEFDRYFPQVGFDHDRQMAQACQLAVKNCPKDNYTIAAEMSQLIGTEVTARQLYKYNSPEEPKHRIRASLIAALCQVTGNYYPLLLVAEPLREIKVALSDEAKERRVLALREKIQEMQAEVAELEGAEGIDVCAN